MADQEEYKKMLTDLIKKQMVVFGPNIALDKARKVPGISLADDGTVLHIDGDTQMVLKAVFDEYTGLSGQVAQMTLDSLLAKYPDVKRF